MAYLNLDPNYFEHPKTRRLIGLLGPMSDVLPIRLWAYCGKIHPTDGAMKAYSAAEVEAVILWQGEPGLAVAALIKVGYLSKTSTGFACVDWRQHEGHLAAFSRRAKAGAVARWSKYASSNAKSKTSNAPTVPAVPSSPPSPTEPENGKRPVGGAVDKLLALVWRIRGDHFGKSVQDLPADYCQWALDGLTDIGPEFKMALRCRITQKENDKTPAQREAGRRA